MKMIRVELINVSRDDAKTVKWVEVMTVTRDEAKTVKRVEAMTVTEAKTVNSVSDDDNAK